MQSKLDEAIDGYKSLDNGTGTGHVEIYISPVFRTFTAYRLDDHFIITLYQHKNHRSGRIPVFKFRRGGSVFSFFEEDLEAVLNGSRRIYP
ncbi:MULTISPECIES: hypothetical protein [unclassified Streptomyces]|uniref:hypothetical protein n=1 Tax=unclassified Streptomyces TaxID=2593676 RepID=UPI0013692D5F|nr:MULTISPECIES: hypothetical protein [unclassified Streptomyces]MYS22772.1 hypothetical protein [Streptomyces sp. SID4948]